VELFDIYDENGRHLGTRKRSECHGNPALLHRAVHVVVLHPDGDRLLLQKRKMTKDIQPGKWDTAVGGHLIAGENYLAAARRELAEELGVAGENIELNELFPMKIRNQIESEDILVYLLVRGEGFTPQAEEIDELRFWPLPELFRAENRRCFTPNLCCEIDKLRDFGVINFGQ